MTASNTSSFKVLLTCPIYEGSAAKVAGDPAPDIYNRISLTPSFEATLRKMNSPVRITREFEPARIGSENTAIETLLVESDRNVDWTTDHLRAAFTHMRMGCRDLVVRRPGEEKATILTGLADIGFMQLGKN